MHYDMEELLEQANEIQESLGRSYAVPDEIDEADLEAGTYTHSFSSRLFRNVIIITELDALQLEEEEEGPSYLSDLNKVPDFVDETPVEISEVCLTINSLSCLTQLGWIANHEGGRQDNMMNFRSLYCACLLKRVSMYPA
jgi:hypothetical protein